MTTPLTTRAMRTAGLLLGGLLCVLAIIGLDGCAACCHTASGVYTLTLSSRGGFSGMMTGFTIDASGRVRYIRRFKGALEESDTLGTLPPEDRDRILTRMRECGVTRVHADSAANMTTTLEGVLDGAAFYLRWPGADSDADSAPESILPLALALRDVLAPFRDKTQSGDIPMHPVEM